ncbi:helix-turn-helix transcriptional regulator [bacterium]|nr:helix-turn-helix transcriptional regulator [bacterium]
MKSSELGKKLGLRIRELRLAKGLKQGELADLLNMERSNLTRIESGKQRPNDENLIKLAGILNIEIKDLFDFSHIDSRQNLIKKIHSGLNALSDKEIQYIYKTVKNIKQLK